MHFWGEGSVLQSHHLSSKVLTLRDNWSAQHGVQALGRTSLGYTITDGPITMYSSSAARDILLGRLPLGFMDCGCSGLDGCFCVAGWWGAREDGCSGLGWLGWRAVAHAEPPCAYTSPCELFYLHHTRSVAMQCWGARLCVGKACPSLRLQVWGAVLGGEPGVAWRVAHSVVAAISASGITSVVLTVPASVGGALLWQESLMVLSGCPVQIACVQAVLFGGWAGGLAGALAGCACLGGVHFEDIRRGRVRVAVCQLLSVGTVVVCPLSSWGATALVGVAAWCCPAFPVPAG